MKFVRLHRFSTEVRAKKMRQDGLTEFISDSLICIKFLLCIVENTVTARLGSGKIVVDRLSISCINGRDNLPHDRLQLAQGIRDRPRIRHADVRPHISIRGSDARRVLESAADELQAGGKIITAAVKEGNESCRRVDILVFFTVIPPDRFAYILLLRKH